MSWTPRRLVLGFGFVSLAADMVYEGARSVYGPVLASLGAGALVVGLVTGAGEAMALLLRLASGPAADRRGNQWTFTIAGYGLTALCVPLLAITPLLGSLGLAVAVTLILAERAGKAIRSPSKSALLATAATKLGRGRGFGVHKALDQLGAFAGPLLVAAIAASVSVWAGLAVLVIPGVAAMALLFAIRRANPSLGVSEPNRQLSWWQSVRGAGLPRAFFLYAAAVSLTTGGLVGFGLISYHLATGLRVPTSTVALIYAGAMAVEAVAALGVGWVYDRFGPRVLLVVPPLVALVPTTALNGSFGWALFGVGVWAVATAVQDSTIKALVAELVPKDRLAGAYGVFAAIQGALAIIGGLVAGSLLDRSVPALIIVIGLAQLVALVILLTQFAARARSVAAG